MWKCKNHQSGARVDALPLTVRFCPPGISIPSATRTVKPDAAGAFCACRMTPGPCQAKFMAESTHFCARSLRVLFWY